MEVIKNLTREEFIEFVESMGFLSWYWDAELSVGYLVTSRHHTPKCNCS